MTLFSTTRAHNLLLQTSLSRQLRDLRSIQKHHSGGGVTIQPNTNEWIWVSSLGGFDWQALWSGLFHATPLVASNLWRVIATLENQIMDLLKVGSWPLLARAFWYPPSTSSPCIATSHDYVPGAVPGVLLPFSLWLAEKSCSWVLI